MLQAYEKKVTSLTNFNLEGRVAGMPAAKMNPPKLNQPLRLPKVSYLFLTSVVCPASKRMFIFICR